MRLSCFLAINFVWVLASADVFPFRNSTEYQNGVMGEYPAQIFVSNPDVLAPVANIIVEAQDGVSPEKYTTWAATGPNIPEQGPQLLAVDTLSVVYQAPLFGSDNFGLTVQTCNGTDYLIWWSGQRFENRAAGMWHIFDNRYESVWNISAINHAFADAHDLFLTPECTAVITVFEPRAHDLTEYGIEDGWIMESYIQEIDLATNTLLFEWQASNHVNINDTLWGSTIRGHLTNTSEESWDFFHMNSIQKDHRGNYLISSRHMSSIYYIDGKTGSIIWTLGGQGNDFTDLSSGRATDFIFQHHALWTDLELNSISLFDDANCRWIKAEDPVSRGLVLTLDTEAMTVKIEKEFKAPSEIKAFRKGGMHYLPNRNALLGYGNEPALTEFAPDGTILWDVRFGPLGGDRGTADNYRSMKVNWTGHPTWNPSIAAGSSIQAPSPLLNNTLPHTAPNDTAYFSWNGATEMERWLVLASKESLNLTSIENLWTELPKLGFETSVQTGNAARYIRVVALGANDTILAASAILDMKDGTTFDAPFDPLALKTERKRVTSHQAQEEVGTGFRAVYDAFKTDWRNLKASTRSIFAIAFCGSMFAITALVAALSKRNFGSCAGLKRRHRQHFYRGLENSTSDEAVEESSWIAFHDLADAEDKQAIGTCVSRSSVDSTDTGSCSKGSSHY